MPENQAPGEITELLCELQAGDRQALEKLFPLVYQELRRRAHWQLSGDNPTLSTTDLVHETYLKLLESSAAVGVNRRHFFNVAARAMRQIVVDSARRRTAAKRGGGQKPITLDEARLGIAEQAADLLALDRALEDLEALDERLARVVELRFFAGLSVEEVAEVLGVTDRTVKRDWRKARTFLYQQIADGVAP